MKKIAGFVLMTIAFKLSLAQYKPIDETSKVQFKIKNLGFTIDGSFSGLSGSILFDPGHPADAKFDVSIDANTINTDNNMRDDHLRKDSYFDIKNFPRIRLYSTKISASGKKGELLFSGFLSIKKETKPVSFPFRADASNGGFLFSGNFTINRRDFEIGGTSTISDMLSVSLNVFAK
jgi:polyisoprenoid-binding protein YceI